MPKVGKSGKAVIVLEAREKNGLAIEQVTFKVNVTKVVNGVENLKFKGLVEVFPNPVSKILTINSSLEGCFIELMDISGKVLYSSMMQGYSTDINVESYTRGIYFINIKGAAFNETRKIIIQ